MSNLGCPDGIDLKAATEAVELKHIAQLARLDTLRSSLGKTRMKAATFCAECAYTEDHLAAVNREYAVWMAAARKM